MLLPVPDINLLLQFSDDFFKVISRTMEVGQGTAQELVAEEESNRRNIDSLVQEPHRKGVPEAKDISPAQSCEDARNTANFSSRSFFDRQGSVTPVILP